MNTAPIEIRVLTPDDAAPFQEVRLEGLQHHPDAFTSTYERESTQPLSFFAERLMAATVFGAFRGAELIGVAGFARQPAAKHAHKGILWGMYVRPTARQSGLGQKLIEAARDHAHPHRNPNQLLGVRGQSPPPRPYSSPRFLGI